MVKTFLTLINSVNIFTIYESLRQNVIKMLPTIFKNKTKVMGDSSKSWVQLLGG